MKYNSNKHHRQSIRLKGYDYSQAGLYFITLCIQNRLHLFGNITNGKMICNEAGKVAQKCWLEIPQHFPNTQLHQYIIMPNHMHGIIEIKTTSSTKKDNFKTAFHEPTPFQSPSKTIGSIIRGYKIGVTKWFRKNMPDQYPVGQRVWQRNYWEHIIRDNRAYENIAAYIVNNPKKWQEDKLYSKDKDS